MEIISTSKQELNEKYLRVDFYLDLSFLYEKQHKKLQLKNVQCNHIDCIKVYKLKLKCISNAHEIRLSTDFKRLLCNFVKVNIVRSKF
jgi:hypothetical protein